MTKRSGRASHARGNGGLVFSRGRVATSLAVGRVMGGLLYVSQVEASEAPVKDPFQTISRSAPSVSGISQTGGSASIATTAISGVTPVLAFLIVASRISSATMTIATTVTGLACGGVAAPKVMGVRLSLVV